MNDGDWHCIKGAFTPNLISGTLDGVPFSITTTESSIYQPNTTLLIQAYSGSNMAVTGRNIVDIASVGLGRENYILSSNWQNILFSVCGNYYATLSGATYSSNWLKDTGSEVYPRNFVKGCKRFTNGTVSEDVYAPLEWNTAAVLALLPAAYSLANVVPALVFGAWEGWVNFPYDPEIKLRDELNKIYTGTTPENLYDDDISGDLGRLVKKDNKGEYRINLRVLKAAPGVFFLSDINGPLTHLDGAGITFTEN